MYDALKPSLFRSPDTDFDAVGYPGQGEHKTPDLDYLRELIVALRELRDITKATDPGSAITSTAAVDVLKAIKQALVGDPQSIGDAGIAKDSEVITYDDSAAVGLAAGALYGEAGFTSAELVEVIIQIQIDTAIDIDSVTNRELYMHSMYTADEGSTPTASVGVMCGHMFEVRLKRPSEWENFKIIAREAYTHRMHVTYLTINP